MVVVPQKLSEKDHFILGAAFMENFYVTYDATSDQPRVGLSYNYDVSTPKSGVEETVIIAAVCVVSILIAIVIVALVTCHRKK